MAVERSVPHGNHLDVLKKLSNLTLSQENGQVIHSRRGDNEKVVTHIMDEGVIAVKISTGIGGVKETKVFGSSDQLQTLEESGIFKPIELPKSNP
jgi:hypothetical protein